MKEIYKNSLSYFGHSWHTDRWLRYSKDTRTLRQQQRNQDNSDHRHKKMLCFWRNEAPGQWSAYSIEMFRYKQKCKKVSRRNDVHSSRTNFNTWTVILGSWNQEVKHLTVLLRNNNFYCQWQNIWHSTISANYFYLLLS